MQIPSDVIEDGIISKPRVFLTSNGPHQNLPDSSEFGTLTPLVPKRIDPHSSFPKLVEQIETTLASANEEDYLLLGNSPIILTIAFSFLFFSGLPVRILEYDYIFRTFRIYHLDDLGSWTTILPTPAKHSS